MRKDCRWQLGRALATDGAHAHQRHVRLDRISTWSKDELVNVVVEAPRGSRLKLKYKPEIEAIEWGHPLPLGHAYPYDWGFVPSTLGADGDPLDALVLAELPSHPGVVIPCRPLAVLELEQKDDGEAWERNDRLVVVPERGGWTNDVRDSRGLPEEMRDELEHFFLSSVFFSHAKARCNGWKGPKAAMRLIREGEKCFRRQT